LVIVQDAYFPTETTKFAHVLLPAAVNLEQSGTFCNSERCVSLMQQIVPPPGDARADWEWAQQIAQEMGFRAGLQFRNAAEIFDEFARSTSGRPNDQSALSHEWLAKVIEGNNSLNDAFQTFTWKIDIDLKNAKTSIFPAKMQKKFNWCPVTPILIGTESGLGGHCRSNLAAAIAVQRGAACLGRLSIMEITFQITNSSKF
jgi:predicted molibdopterin-dependent oxidoreductase YjgC